MNHNGWHRATVPQGLQNMLNKLVPQSCKDMNAGMNNFTCMHGPHGSTEFLSLHWLKSSFRIFLSAWPGRGRGGGEHSAGWLLPLGLRIIFISSDSSVGSALDAAPLYVTMSCCPTSLKEYPSSPWGPCNFISSHLQLQDFFRCRYWYN